MAIIPCCVVVREPTTAVALLTWVYRDQKADLMSGRGLCLAGEPRGGGDDLAPARRHPWPLDSCAVIGRTARLGLKVRGTAHLQRPALHPDAEAVHDIVVRLSRSDPQGAWLLCTHGRLGDGPEPCDEPARPEPVHRRTGNNRRKIIEDAALPASGPFCPLRYQPSLESVAEVRAEYRLWWNALARLTASLPELRRWQVTALGAAEIPWNWEVAQPPPPPHGVAWCAKNNLQANIWTGNLPTQEKQA